MYEISAILKNGYMKHQDEWEQSRLIAYVIAQCNSTKTIKPEQIISFEWDKNNSRKKQITNEQIKKTEQMMKNMEAYLQNKKKATNNGTK